MIRRSLIIACPSLNRQTDSLQVTNAAAAAVLSPSLSVSLSMQNLFQFVLISYVVSKVLKLSIAHQKQSAESLVVLSLECEVK